MFRRSMTAHALIFTLTVVIVPLAFAHRSGSPSGQRRPSKPAPPRVVLKTVNPQLGGPKAFKPGESWKGTMTITGIPRYKPGSAYPPSNAPPDNAFEVTADPLNAVKEVDEKNNTRVAHTPDPCYVK
jgi:hypothetical protein